MQFDGTEILRHLHSVANERALRLSDRVLGATVHDVKLYQHHRFALTYADMLADPRYAKAARFFLEDLYGPRDFSERDDQFARVVPALVRLFPNEIVATVRALAELHALSEELDTKMARALRGDSVNAAGYRAAWRVVDDATGREHQIALMLLVGKALDRYTRNPVLRHSLRLMRGPAQAAGLGVIQQFLERGFDTFREVRGAAYFLDVVAKRERALAAALFADGTGAGDVSFLGQLP